MWNDMVYMHKVKQDVAQIAALPIVYFVPTIDFSSRNPLLLPRPLKKQLDLYLKKLESTISTDVLNCSSLSDSKRPSMSELPSQIHSSHSVLSPISESIFLSPRTAHRSDHPIGNRYRSIGYVWNKSKWGEKCVYISLLLFSPPFISWVICHY